MTKRCVIECITIYKTSHIACNTSKMGLSIAHSSWGYWKKGITWSTSMLKWYHVVCSWTSQSISPSHSTKYIPNPSQNQNWVLTLNYTFNTLRISALCDHWFVRSLVLFEQNLNCDSLVSRSRIPITFHVKCSLAHCKRWNLCTAVSIGLLSWCVASNL